MTTAKKPYDLQAKYAQTAGEPFEFTWADQVWVLPSPRMIDVAVLDQIDNLDPSAANLDTFNTLFDGLMGPEQGARWREVSPRPLPMLMELIDAWQEHGGEQLGESPASDGSSKSTGRPSSRTSNASTASASRKPSSRRPRKSATPAVS